MVKLTFLLLIMLAGIALIVRFVQWYSGFCYRMIVSRPSQVLDQLLLTGMVPESWRWKRLEKAALRSENFIGHLLQRLILHHYVRKMPGVISFARGNHRISPEETRAVEKELRAIVESWKSSGLAALVGDEFQQ